MVTIESTSERVPVACCRHRRLEVAIDGPRRVGVDAGRVVKGVKFKELRDAGDPVQIAQAYESQGADELVFLDITASSD